MTRAWKPMPITLRGRHRRSDGMGARVVALCRRFAGWGWLLAVLVGVPSCNSLLGIREAELTCDTPPCELANPSELPDPDATADRGNGRAPDGGTARAGANESSNTGSTGSAPAGSGASRDGTPVAPVGPPQSADPDRSASDVGMMGGSGGAAAEPSSAGAISDPSASAAGAPSSSGAGGEAGRVSCGDGDACGACLCEACEAELAACTDTPGCFEIRGCARNTGCRGPACYCGTVGLAQCATTDLANGPCIEVMLAAPGAHPPSLIDPNAGPASLAALNLADCSRLSCAIACGD